MQQNLKKHLLEEIQLSHRSQSLEVIFKDESIIDILDQLVNILLREKGDISNLAAIHLLEIMGLVDEKSKKFQYERIYLTIISNYKENEVDIQLILAQTLGALLRRFNTFLSISDYDLFSLIISPKRNKMIKGLILLREITSMKQWFKSDLIGTHKDNSLNKMLNPLQLLQQAGQATIYGYCEVIDCIANKWEKKKSNVRDSSIKVKDIKDKDEFDCNQLIGICFIQLQNQMNQRQKKRAYPLVLTLLNSPKFAQDDRDILYNFLNFLKTCDSNFFLNREAVIFKRLSSLLRLYKVEDNILEVSEQRNKDIKIIEQNRLPSVLLGLYVFEETVERTLNKKCRFLAELIEYLFSMCEIDQIVQEDTSHKAQSNKSENQLIKQIQKASHPQYLELDQAFTDFQYQLETINQSSKKILMSEQIFKMIFNKIKEVGRGKETSTNEVEYTEKEIRILLGCYNMLFYQTKCNVDPIRAILGHISKFISFHLNNPSLFCYVVRFLFQIAVSAINYITPYHQSYMNIIINIVCNQSTQSQDQIMGISFLDRVISKILYEEDFSLFDYIPKIYEFCLREYSSPQFLSFQPIYKETLFSLINCILHKKKIEYYIKPYVQPSKEIFLSYFEKHSNKSITNQIKSSMEEEEEGDKCEEQKEDNNSTFHLSCLSSLAKMVMKSEHCKDEDLVNRVKNLLREYATDLYNGKFDNQQLSRTEIYQFMYSISIEYLNDQALIDELFLKMYTHIIADCQINTNVKLIRKNIDEDDQFQHDQFNLINFPIHVPNQANINAPNQVPLNAPNQVNLNAPNQVNLNAPNQVNLNEPNQVAANQVPVNQVGANQNDVNQDFENEIQMPLLDPQIFIQQINQMLGIDISVQNIAMNQNMNDAGEDIINEDGQEVINQNNQMGQQNPQQYEENSDDFESTYSDEEIDHELNQNIVNQPVELQVQYQQQGQGQNQHQEEDDEEEDEDDEAQNDNEDDGDYEQVYFEQPNILNVNLKSNALYLLGEFIQESPQIVMENKKFEIVKVLMEISMDDREETSITYMNYQTFGQMFKCVQKYFQKYYPDQYLQEKVENPEKDGILSEEACTEYAPLIQIFLNQIDNLDKLNEDNIHEELLCKLTYVLRNIDGPTKRTYFDQIFNTIKSNIIKTLQLFQSGLIDKQMESLQIMFKSSPNKIKSKFSKFWNIIQKNFFNIIQDEDEEEEEEQQQDENEQEGSDENDMEMEGDKEITEDEEVAEEQDTKVQQKQGQLNLTKDLSVVHSCIGYTSHFIKYDKSVYPIVSKIINRMIIDKIIYEDEVLLRNCIYYVNVVTRYCYEMIEPDTFQSIFQAIRQIVTSKKLNFDEKGTVENIYATYALMATKLFTNSSSTSSQAKNSQNVMMEPFQKLFSIVPFEDDFPEMKRVIMISEFLFDQDQPIVKQNLQKVILSVVSMINEPSRYRIKKKNEHLYHSFFKKLVNRYPETQQISLNIINANDQNQFKEKQVLLDKLGYNQ